MKLKNITHYLTSTLPNTPPERFHRRLARWAVRQYKLLYYTARGMIDHATMIRSAALTFYTLISIVPILALIFAVVKGFGLADGLVENIYAAFPQSPEVIDYLVEFAQKALARTQGGIVALAGLVTLFWAVIRVFSSVESAFNNIWEVKSTRSVTRKYTDYFAIVMVVPILWIIANALGTYAQQLLGLSGSTLSNVLAKGASLVVIWIMFTFLYITVPNTKVKWGSALTAGILAGTAFTFFQWGYLYLQRWMTSYNAIYGSFAALPLFLIWLQASWQILLFGGELSFAYQNISRFDDEQESLLVSNDDRRKVILAVMLLAVRNLRDGRGAITADELRNRLNLPVRLLNDVIFNLVRSGLLIQGRTSDDEKEAAFTPACDIHLLTVYDVLQAVEQFGQTRFALDDSPEMKEITTLVGNLRDCVREQGMKTRLIDLP